MPFDLTHPSCIFHCLLFACRTIQEPWRYAQVNQLWSEVVRPTESGGLGARIWLSPPHNVTAIPRHSKMTELTRIFQELKPAFQIVEDIQLITENAIKATKENKNKHNNNNGKKQNSIEREALLKISSSEYDEHRLRAESQEKVLGKNNVVTSTSKIGSVSPMIGAGSFTTNVGGDDDPLHNVFVLQTDPFYSVLVIRDHVSIYAKHIDMSGFGSLIQIRNNFQAHNWRVVEMDFSSPSLKNLNFVGDNFCRDCAHLRRITFSDEMCVESIGSNFLAGTAIEEIDLCFLSPTKFLRFFSDFLARCWNLKRVKNLGRVAKCLQTIERGFLKGAANLESIDFRDEMTSNTSSSTTNKINDKNSHPENDDNTDSDASEMMENVAKVVSEFSQLASLNSVDFLRGCSALIELDLSFLPQRCLIHNLEKLPASEVHTVKNDDDQGADHEKNQIRFMELTYLTGLERFTPSRYHVAKVGVVLLSVGEKNDVVVAEQLCGGGVMIPLGTRKLENTQEKVKSEGCSIQ